MKVQFIRFNEDKNTVEGILTDGEKRATFKHCIPLDFWLKTYCHSEIIKLLVDDKPVINMEYWEQTSDFKKFEPSILNSWD